MMEADFESVLALCLVFLYCLLGLICTLQISRIIYYQHPIRSFQFWFLFICLCWSVLRIVFFVDSAYLRGRALMTLYWMPVDLQFITFSLLVLFYAFLLYQHSWEQKRICLLVIYFFVNFTVCLATAVYIYIGCDSQACHKTSLNFIHHVYMAIQFFVLVATYGYFSYRLYKRRSSSSLPWSSAPSSLTALTLISFLVFLSRWLYNTLVAIDSKRFAMNLVYGGDGMVNVNFGTFALLCLWEVLPSAMVLYFFREIPRTQQTLCTRLCNTPARPALAPSSPARINSQALLGYSECEYDPASGCCDGWPGTACLSRSCLGPLAATLCCKKKYQVPESTDDGVGGDYPGGGYANYDLYGYDGVEPGYNIMAPPQDYREFGIPVYAPAQSPGVGPTADLQGSPGYRHYPSHSYAGMDEQQLQAHIQAHIQAQLEHHARQDDYLG